MLKQVLLFLSFYLSTSLSFSEVQPIESKWSKTELGILQSLSLYNLPKKMESPSNRYDDDIKAAAFGKVLFFDTRLSGNGRLSCASCHNPDHYFTDALPKAVGLKPSMRNTPTVVGTAWGRWFYWDGRRDSLWSQALVPFEASDEMGSSRLAIVKRLYTDTALKKRYEKVFGSLPEGIYNPQWPENAGPFGNLQVRTQWYQLPEDSRHEINKIYSNIGKAVAAYQRTLKPKITRFDNYVNSLVTGGEVVAVSKEEVLGIKLFIDLTKTQCLQCHNGPLFTNQGFHNIGTGKFTGESMDFGRMLGVQAVLMDEFNCLGEYSDAKPEECHALRFLNKAGGDSLKGAYKTPSLRNIAKTAPYFHDGSKKTLNDIVRFYNEPPVNNGNHEIKQMGLTDQELNALVDFLEMLTEVE